MTGRDYGAMPFSVSSRRTSVLIEVEAHRAQYVRRLDELDIGIFDHLDPIATPASSRLAQQTRRNG
jgi:hypothetical protein